MLKSLIIFLLIGLSSIVCKANNKGYKQEMDSVLQIFNSNTIPYNDIDQYEKLGNQIIELATKLEDLQTIFEVRISLVSFMRNLTPEKIKLHIIEMDSLINCCKDKFSSMILIDYYLIKGYSEGRDDNLLLELNYYLKADSISTIEKDREMYLHVNQHFYFYYYKLKDYKKALELVQKDEREYFTPSDYNSYEYLSTLTNIGSAHYYLENYDSSIFFMKKTISSGIENYDNLLFQYSFIGKSYMELNILDSAYYYLNLTLTDRYKEDDYSIEMIEVYIQLAKLYGKLGNYNKAVYHSEKAIQLSDSINYTNGIINSRKQFLLNSFKVKGYVDLYAGFETYLHTVKSIYNNQVEAMELRFKLDFDTYKKEAEITELEKEKILNLKKHENEQKLSETKKTILIIGIIASIVFTLLIISGYRRKQLILKQRIIVEEFEKNKIQDLIQEREKELNQKIDLLKDNNRLIGQLKSEITNHNLENKQSEQTLLLLDQNYISDKQWAGIVLHFSSLHPSFIHKIKEMSEDITQNDIRLALLIKLGYDNHQISDIINISFEGVRKAKQRLKKKLNNTSIENIDKLV